MIETTAQNCKGVWKAADHMGMRQLRQCRGRRPILTRNTAESRSMTAASLTVFTPPLVTPQALLEMRRRLIGTLIRVGRYAFRFQQSAGIEMQHAFRSEREAVFSNARMAGVATVEVFRRGLVNARRDALLQSWTDVDVSP